MAAESERSAAAPRVDGLSPDPGRAAASPKGDRFIRRIRTRHRNGLILGFVLAAAWGLVWVPMGLGVWMNMIGLVVCIYLPTIHGTLHEASVRRRLKAAGYRLCPRCGYDLSGLGDEGACPECGRGFLAASLAEQWAGAGLATRGEQLQGHRSGR